MILSTRRYKAGYEVREELHKTDFHAELLSGEADEDTDELLKLINTEQVVIVKSSYTPTGDYIGSKRNAHFLCSKRGIKPEKVDPSKNVCSIGFCEKEQKWYGWSHRAIFGFGIGSIVKEGNSSGWIAEYLIDHPEADLSLPVGFTAKTMGDARRMAIAFAESVG